LGPERAELAPLRRTFARGTPPSTAAARGARGIICGGARVMTKARTRAASEPVQDGTLRTRLLYEAHVLLDRVVNVGATPHGVRRITAVRGGAFQGPSMRGEILPGGADWLLLRPDGVVELDIRVAGQLDDGALVYVTERGYLRAPPEVLERIARGAPVDPDAYTLRIVSSYETASSRYAWLNGALGVGHETIHEGWLDLTVHEVL
jgi:hypothetical protein